VPASDGGGVILTRIIGARGLEQLDPFLLFDVFRSRVADYIDGFPPDTRGLLKAAAARSGCRV
jgi:hypothetical protein